MANRRVAAPLRVTERADYALKSLLLLSVHEGDYLTTKEMADHFGMSPKMLASVLQRLRDAGIVESRRGWQGGFRLGRPPGRIALNVVIAATASGNERSSALPNIGARLGPHLSTPELNDRVAELVNGFWRALDDHIQGTLSAFTVADLARGRPLP